MVKYVNVIHFSSNNMETYMTAQCFTNHVAMCLFSWHQVCSNPKIKRWLPINNYDCGIMSQLKILEYKTIIVLYDKWISSLMANYAYAVEGHLELSNMYAN